MDADMDSGGASGFGRALAERLVNGGSKGSAKYVVCDVTKKADLQKLFDEAKSSFGGFDVMVNNAGITEKAEFTVIDINLNAVILGTRLALSHLIQEKKQGVIINTASLAGLYPQPYQPIYAASKAGVVQFTRSLSTTKDLYGIRTVAVCPSFSPTPLIEGVHIDPAYIVPVSLVIDAFMMAISDESLSGDCIRVTPKYGLDVVGRKKRAKL
eukprot:jgi/Hompol1/5408/HPOL_001990-RA